LPLPVTLNRRFALLLVFIFGMKSSPRTANHRSSFGGLLRALFVSSSRLRRTHEHHHRSSLDMGRLINRPDLAQLRRKAIEQILADLLVSHLASTKEDAELHLIACFEELACLSPFGLEIVVVDLGPNSNLFQVRGLLSLAGLSLAPALLVAEFAIVHEAAYRGDRVRLNFDQVETAFTRHFHCVSGANDAYVVALFVDESNLWDSNSLVDACRS
jgi:hypothetical protein